MNWRRWDVGLVTALVTIGFGLLLAQPLLVTGAIIGLIYALYGSMSSLPPETNLSATREFEIAGSGPGAEVDVTLEIENTGEAVLPDVRVVDGVPDELTVISDSPRGCSPLAPGKSLTVEYTVVLQRGRFEFESPVCRLRSLAGSDKQTVELAVDGDAALTCANTLTNPPLADATLQHAGTVPTDTGGSGLEFYSTRQYHRGDPMSRINWHQVAKTGEFVTVQYRREQAARTVIVVDCRPRTRVRPRSGYPTGGALAGYAAERLHESLRKAGIVTSLTAVGLETELDHLIGPDGLPWIDSESTDGSATALFRGVNRAANAASSGLSIQPPSPAAETASRSAAGMRADGDPTTRHPQPGTGEQADWRQTANQEPDTESPESADEPEAGPPGDLTERLLSRFPPEAEVVLCSPLLDNWPVEFAQECTLRGYSCQVISPNVTAGDTDGQRIGSIYRNLRLRTLEDAGVQATDWPINYPVEYALARTLPQQ